MQPDAIAHWIAAVMGPVWRAQQTRYRAGRRRRAWRGGRPYSADIGRPDPGEIAAIDVENG